MTTLKKLLFLTLFLVLFYYIFIVNIMVTLGIIASIYVLFKLNKIRVRHNLKKISSSKELFQQSELGLFTALVAKLAKADGRVDELEAQLIGNMFDDISKIFPDKEKARKLLKEIFNEEKEKNDDVKEIAQALNVLLKRRILKRRQFIGFLIQLASAGNGISADEDRVLREIVNELNIPPEVFNAMLSRFTNKQQSMSVAQAATILGVKQSDDMDTIKKTYRNLVRQYHPDIIKSQDKDDEYMEEATAKTQEINQAYETLKKAKKQTV